MIVDTPTKEFGYFNNHSGPMLLETKEHKSGLFYRIGVVDLLSIKEAFSNYKNVNVTNRIVMDLGANVGGFSFLATKNGAKEIHSFEPEPYTYAMLVQNVGKYNNCYLYNRAISNSDDEYVGLYVGRGAGAPSLASIEKKKGRDKIPVLNENFKKMCEKIQPNTIKIDIEGGEYNIVLDIPDSCDELSLEWHGSGKVEWSKFEKIYPLFLEHGWKPIFEKKRESFKKHSISKGLTPKWAMDGHYRR